MIEGAERGLGALAGMKTRTDHLPFRSASVTSMNLPFLNAWTLKGWTLGY